MNTYQGTELMSYNFNTESYLLIQVEQFMIEISYCLDFYSIDELKVYLIELIPAFKAVYNPYYQYTYPIQSFLYLMKTFDQMLAGQGYDLIATLSNDQILHVIALAQYEMQYHAYYNYERYRQELRNQQRLNSYLQQLIHHYSRLLFVRVDLAYQPEYHQYITAERFVEDIKILCGRIGNQDTCFSGIQGYAWALEQGVIKGYHCHLLLIYDGNKHQNDFGLGLQVSQSWNQITHEMGTAFVCNSPEHKAAFKKMGMLGIGMIHRDNPMEVTNALNTAQYLVNPEKHAQHLRAKPMANTRTFATGQYHVSWRRGLRSVC